MGINGGYNLERSKKDRPRGVTRAGRPSRIDARGTARGNVGSEDRNGREEQQHRHERGSIGCGDAVEESRNQLSHASDPTAEAHAQQSQDHSLPLDEREYLSQTSAPTA